MSRDAPAHAGPGPPGTGAGALSRLIIGEPSLVESPEGPGLAEVRRIQPYQADKTYICPGCNQEIRPGTGPSRDRAPVGPRRPAALAHALLGAPRRQAPDRALSG